MDIPAEQLTRFEPRRSKKSKSLQTTNCRQCGGKGDVIALVQHIDGCDFKTAVFMLTGEPAPDGKGNGLAKAIAKEKVKLSVVPPVPPEVVKEEPAAEERTTEATKDGLPTDYVYLDEHGQP